MSDLINDFVAYGVTDFCQDLRIEVGGTVTLVGVFITDMYIPSFPAVVPKLAFATTIIIPKSDLRGKNYHVKAMIYFPSSDPNDVPVQVERDVPGVDLAPISSDVDPDIPTHAKLVQHVVISPAQIMQPGYLKVRVEVDGRLIRAGVLRIVQGTPPDPFGKAGTLNAERPYQG